MMISSEDGATLRAVALAASTDSNRAAWCRAVLVESDGTVVASDSYRLHYGKVSVALAGELARVDGEDGKVLLDASMLLKAISAGRRSGVQVSAESGYVLAQAGGKRFAISVVADRFADWRSLVPKDAPTGTVDAAAVAAAVKAWRAEGKVLHYRASVEAGWVASTRGTYNPKPVLPCWIGSVNGRVRMLLPAPGDGNGDARIVQRETGSTYAREVGYAYGRAVDALIGAGDGIGAAFNPNMLADAVDAASTGGGKVGLVYRDMLKPILLVGERVRALLMPVRGPESRDDVRSIRRVTVPVPELPGYGLTDDERTAREIERSAEMAAWLDGAPAEDGPLVLDAAPSPTRKPRTVRKPRAPKPPAPVDVPATPDGPVCANPADARTKTERKARNLALAAAVRGCGLVPNGETWDRAKQLAAAGEPITRDALAREFAVV